MPDKKEKVELQVYKCSKCPKTIAKAYLAPGSIVQILCKCKTYNTIQVPPSAN